MASDEKTMFATTQKTHVLSSRTNNISTSSSLEKWKPRRLNVLLSRRLASALNIEGKNDWQCWSNSSGFGLNTFTFISQFRFTTPVNNWLGVIFESSCQFHTVGHTGLSIKTGVNIFVISINVYWRTEDIVWNVFDEDKQQRRTSNRIAWGILQCII